MKRTYFPKEDETDNIKQPVIRVQTLSGFVFTAVYKAYNTPCSTRHQKNHAQLASEDVCREKFDLAAEVSFQLRQIQPEASANATRNI